MRYLILALLLSSCGANVDQRAHSDPREESLRLSLGISDSIRRQVVPEWLTEDFGFLRHREKAKVTYCVEKTVQTSMCPDVKPTKSVCSSPIRICKEWDEDRLCTAWDCTDEIAKVTCKVYFHKEEECHDLDENSSIYRGSTTAGTFIRIDLGNAYRFIETFKIEGM